MCLHMHLSEEKYCHVIKTPAAFFPKPQDYETMCLRSNTHVGATQLVLTVLLLSDMFFHVKITRTHT
jgi:hypothetical protein